MTSPDIRAGQALLIAALSAKGKGIIHNVHQIDRGCQQIDEPLNTIGADYAVVTTFLHDENFRRWHRFTRDRMTPPFNMGGYL